MSHHALGSPFTLRVAEWFVSFTMTILAMLKLQDVEKFSSMFVGYDLLAQRWVPYAYAYPFLEATAGMLMAAHAVYIQKREIKCACVGGSSRVPLGFVSLTGNLFMIGMAVWMIVHP